MSTESRTTISYFFTERQVHDPCSFSKSPLKPALLHRIIQEDMKFSQVETRIEPIEPERMKQVHASAYIDGLMAGEIADGFGNKSKKDMQAIRTTVANFLAAAECALTTSPIVWSLTSGFHHARYAGGGGFCTINGLMLSAFELWKFHNARTLIVDGDGHFGDGCVDILEHKPEMKEYVSYFQHYDQRHYRALLEQAIREHNPNLIMYQAGADDWIGDPLGGTNTMVELYQRDMTTFALAKLHGIPVVCNLAGGYAENFQDTLLIHLNTGEAMKEVYLGYGIANCKEEW
jgi:acetoin utilization deacetylase AcuC-like enzyme